MQIYKHPLQVLQDNKVENGVKTNPGHKTRLKVVNRFKKAIIESVTNDRVNTTGKQPFSPASSLLLNIFLRA
jgi:hypothetical protein